MGTQLTLFAPGLHPDFHAELALRNKDVKEKLTSFSRRMTIINRDLARNREYIIFTRRLFRVALSFGNTSREIEQSLRVNNLKSRLFLAKNELTEAKSWLDLLSKGNLLKGSYENLP